jgi:hypothetical protein
MARVETREFTEAGAFLRALLPPTERPIGPSCVFRGQADSSWKLLPSINRRSVLRDFAKDADVEKVFPSLAGDSNYCDLPRWFESRLIMDFAEA